MSQTPVDPLADLPLADSPLADSPLSDSPLSDSPLANSQLNPYQPTAETVGELDDDATSVTFRLTPGVLRHATDHYLLRFIPKRLGIGSLLMIAISWWAIISSVKYGLLAWLVVGAACLGGSTAIYLAIAHSAKMQVRRKNSELGLEENAVVSVRIAADMFLLTSSNGEHQWPRGEIRLMRTHSGLLVSPEPLASIFIPRKNESSPIAFDTLKAKLKKA